MKKQNKKVLNIFLISLIVLGIIGVYYFATNQSFIGIPGVPEEKTIQTFSFDGVSGTAKSTYFGSISNSGGLEFQQVKEGFCGSDDADISLSNSLSDGDKLTLSSSMRNSKQNCNGGTNYITIEEITFPAGKLTGSCTVSATERGDGRSIASCSVGSFSLTAVQQRDCAKGQQNINAGFWEANCINDKSDTFERVFTEPTTIKVQVISLANYVGSASANLQMDFEPSSLPIEENQTEVVNPPIIPTNPSDVLENPENYLPLIILVSIVLLIIMFLFLKKKRGKK